MKDCRRDNAVLSLSCAEREAQHSDVSPAIFGLHVEPHVVVTLRSILPFDNETSHIISSHQELKPLLHFGLQSTLNRFLSELSTHNHVK